MKTYQKPQLFYEKFELSQHIASCDLKLNFGLGSGCTASGMAGGYLPITKGFVIGDCVEGVEGYCYTNSIAIIGTHTS